MSKESSPYEVSESVKSSVSSPSAPSAVATSLSKVFGIINIVYAALGMVSAFSGVLMMSFFKVMVDQLDGQAAELEAILKAYEGVASYAYIDMGVKLALGILLLVAGIGLLRKKAWGLTSSLFWAGIRIVAAIVTVILTAGPTRLFQEKVAEIQGESNAEMVKVQEMVGEVGNIVGVVMLCIYPVVVLIFLSKKSAKQGLS